MELDSGNHKRKESNSIEISLSNAGDEFSDSSDDEFSDSNDDDEFSDSNEDEISDVFLSEVMLLVS